MKKERIVKIKLQPYSGKFGKKLKLNWELIGSYRDGGIQFKSGYKTKADAFKEMLEITNHKNIVISI